MAESGGPGTEVESAGAGTGEANQVLPPKRGFTDEMRAKAAATRAKNKQDKEDRLARKAARDEAQGAIGSGNLQTGNGILTKKPIHPGGREKHGAANGFDWERSSLPEAMQRLADMKREYDRVSQIVLRRQSVSTPQWTCFTQLHKDLIPKSVQALCRKTGENGKWASRDDGAFKTVDGIRVPDPQFCCSAICHEYYLKSKPMHSLSRH